jgi:hypothetical protein
MKRVTPEVRLERLLERLSAEVVAATDEEVMRATAALRMNLGMRGTLAFLGLKGPLFPYDADKFPDPGNELGGAAGQEGSRGLRAVPTRFKE